MKGGFDLTTTICHRATKNLKTFTSQADLIVSATGIPNLITRDMVKSGSILIDVGLCRSSTNPKLISGDIEPGCRELSSHFTPVPGGVGPVTVACLMKNTVLAAQRKAQLEGLI